MDKMYYTQEELLKIQELESDALSEVIRICDIIGVKCFLVGGTALGAVRHKGFIPWDDDIDVGFLRDDYDIFLREAPNYLVEKYYLQTPYNNPINPYFYSKIRINGTEFVEYCNHRLPIHHGVYIDLFPFDEVPDDDKKNKKQFDICRRLIVLFSVRQSPDRSQKAVGVIGKIKTFLRFVFHCVLKLIPHDFLVKITDSNLKKYNGTGQSGYASLFYPKRNEDYILQTDLLPLKKVTFGNVEAYIPRDCDKYLKTHYGDYLKLPPEDKRIGHKPYKVDLN